MLSHRSCPECTLDLDFPYQEYIQNSYDYKRYKAVNHQKENYKQDITPSVPYKTEAFWSLIYEDQRACEENWNLASAG